MNLIFCFGKPFDFRSEWKFLVSQTDKLTLSRFQVSNSITDKIIIRQIYFSVEFYFVIAMNYLGVN